MRKQVGIGGWQVPRAALKNMRDRQTNILTMQDIEDLGMDKVSIFRVPHVQK